MDASLYESQNFFIFLGSLNISFGYRYIAKISDLFHFLGNKANRIYCCGNGMMTNADVIMSILTALTKVCLLRELLSQGYQILWKFKQQTSYDFQLSMS